MNLKIYTLHQLDIAPPLKQATEDEEIYLQLSLTIVLRHGKHECQRAVLRKGRKNLHRKLR